MQLNLPINTWGGKRKGAGRPAQRYRSSEEHTSRERFDRVTPFHVTRVALPAQYRPLPVRRARTWLLNVGWRKAGELSCKAVPGG